MDVKIAQDILRALFMIPALMDLLKYKKQGSMIDYIYEIFISTGNTFYIKLVGVYVQFTVDPENIKAVLATQFNDFALGSRHAHFAPLLGDGIFTLDFEGWKNSRAMLRPQFSREQVAHVKSLEPHIQRLAKHIRNSKGDTIDMQVLFHKLTMDTATEFLFGESVSTLSDASIGEEPPVNFEGRLDFADAFTIAQSYLSTRAYSQFLYFLINGPEFRKANARVHKTTQYYIREALKTDPEDLEKKSAGGYTFLYELVKQTRDPKILQDQALNILLAGRDTTAGLLSFTLLELSRNKRIFEKLKKEIYENFGSGEDSRLEEISFETLKKCEYLKFVINEALRLYPSVPVNFRVATRDTTLPRGGGADGTKPVYIPKGTTVAYSVYTTHRLKEYYGEDALEFKPERWADIKRIGWAYVPFNGGPRICLGQQFALTEASYVITRLIQLFPNLECRDNDYPPKKNVQLTMCLQNGCQVSMS
ncbi:hypothetical protein QCA50_018148 [Cerrena zonata]|uniref:Uncharacterized protein n=1 Tax=Cerrena zonata TaxID=2478898 RepID=A0AAW0FE18_9APHY